MKFSVLFVAGMTLHGLASGLAQDAPKGFEVPASSLSPGGVFGVTVPKRAEFAEAADPKNAVIEIRTGRIVARIDAVTGWDHMNHGEIFPARWSPDGALLLWEVDGKWFPKALVLLALDAGKLRWQVDLLATAQRAILACTRKVAPGRYAEARKANEGNGSAYPEGFSVDVEALDPLAFPLRIRAALTSNPKGIPDFPTLESHLEAAVDKNGRFEVTEFALGPGPSTHF